MGILPTAATGIPADRHVVGDQCEETGDARATAGPIDCRIPERTQAWTSGRLEQEIEFSTPCRRAPASTSNLGPWDKIPVKTPGVRWPRRHELRKRGRYSSPPTGASRVTDPHAWYSVCLCLASALGERAERDVYVASAWHPDSESGLRKPTSQEIAHGLKAGLVLRS